MTKKTKDEHCHDAAKLVREALENLQRTNDIPTDCLLLGAHAEIIATMTLHLGGPKTAMACDWAAGKVRNLPSAHAASLAFARPTGRA